MNRNCLALKLSITLFFCFLLVACPNTEEKGSWDEAHPTLQEVINIVSTPVPLDEELKGKVLEFSSRYLSYLHNEGDNSSYGDCMAEAFSTGLLSKILKQESSEFFMEFNSQCEVFDGLRRVIDSNKGYQFNSQYNLEVFGQALSMAFKGSLLDPGKILPMLFEEQDFNLREHPGSVFTPYIIESNFESFAILVSAIAKSEVTINSNLLLSYFREFQKQLSQLPRPSIDYEFVENYPRVNRSIKNSHEKYSAESAYLSGFENRLNRESIDQWWRFVLQFREDRPTNGNDLVKFYRAYIESQLRIIGHNLFRRAAFDQNYEAVEELFEFGYRLPQFSWWWRNEIEKKGTDPIETAEWNLYYYLSCAHVPTSDRSDCVYEIVRLVSRYHAPVLVQEFLATPVTYDSKADVLMDPKLDPNLYSVMNNFRSKTLARKMREAVSEGAVVYWNRVNELSERWPVSIWAIKIIFQRQPDMKQVEVTLRYNRSRVQFGEGRIPYSDRQTVVLPLFVEQYWSEESKEGAHSRALAKYKFYEKKLQKLRDGSRVNHVTLYSEAKIVERKKTKDGQRFFDFEAVK